MPTPQPRQIPNTCEIQMYLHCGFCLDELPEGVSPKDFAAIQVGWTEIGLQVWCSRHEVNIMHVDFEGRQHPANTTASQRPKERPKVRTERRQYVEGCRTCENVKANNGFGPPHDASYGCESNHREHCSCDLCF